MESKKTTIGFTYINEFGDQFEAKTTADTMEEIYASELDYIGAQFNIFLKQCGYPRRNDYMLMADITEDEWEKLTDYLAELRRGDVNAE